jgi:hypothetical protein
VGIKPAIWLLPLPFTEEHFTGPLFQQGHYPFIATNRNLPSFESLNRLGNLEKDLIQAKDYRCWFMQYHHFTVDRAITIAV